MIKLNHAENKTASRSSITICTGLLKTFGGSVECVKLMYEKAPEWKLVNLGDLPPGVEAAGENAGCTSTLIECGNRKILVDPGYCHSGDFQTLLFRRTGYMPEDIDTVFLTHFHHNHWKNIHLFRKSVWLMSRVEIHWWLRHKEISTEEKHHLIRIQPVEEHRLPLVDVLQTPGHTHGSTSLLIETREGMVVIAGDAVLTFDHFDILEPSFNAEDQDEARRSIQRIAKMADIIVPGHDNFFVV